MKDVPTIGFMGSTGYSSYRKMIYVGPKKSNSLVPIVQDDEGYINIAAGTYGKGKFLIFPWIEKYLKDGPPADCIENWKYKGTPYTGCAITYSGSPLWCPTGVDSDYEYILGSENGKNVAVPVQSMLMEGSSLTIP